MAFEMVALGDSIMWGQGLDPANKFSTLVKNWLQNKVGDTVNLHPFAHSGAIISPHPDDHLGQALGREVPNKAPSITWQVDKVTNTQNINLVLVDGGINDLSLEVLLNSLTGEAAIGNWVENRLRNLMKDLLEKVVATFPNAKIIVTGYYPIVSPATNLNPLAGLLTLFGHQHNALNFLVSEGLQPVFHFSLFHPILTRLSNQCKVFYDQSNIVFTNLVNGINAITPNRATFAQIPFNNNNSYGASNTLLWLIGELDQVSLERATQCSLATIPPKLTCLDAATGHPNVDGARLYADTITNLLPALGF